MLLNVLMTAYAVVVAFVLASAERNRRELRPHGAVLTMAGQVACGASGSLAALMLGWALLYANGLVATLPAI